MAALNIMTGFDNNTADVYGQAREYQNNAYFFDTSVLMLAVGRAYDRMQDASEEDKRLDMMFKGYLLKSVYNHIKAGGKLNILRRSEGLSTEFKSKGRSSDPVTMLLNFNFTYPAPITEELVMSWVKIYLGSWPLRDIR